MTITRLLVPGIITLWVLFGMGCVPGPMTLSQDTGVSFRRMKDNQSAKPAGAASLAPVLGLDGWAAVVAHQHYLRTFEGTDQTKAVDGGAGFTAGSMLQTGR